MAAVLDQISVWVQRIILELGYPGIAAIMFIENIFPPIPSELVLPFAGFLAAQGLMSFAGIMVSATAGALLGAMVIYSIGRKVGEARTRLWFRRYGRYALMSEADFDRASRAFNRYGKIMVLLAHMLPGIRSFIAIPAGINRMSIIMFLLLTALGAAAWNAILAYAGLLLGQNWSRVLAFTDRYELAIWATLAAAVIAFIVRRVRGRAASR